MRVHKGGKMNKKKGIAIGVCVLMLFASNAFSQTKQLKEIGRYPLVQCKAEIPSSEVMRILVDRYAADIKYGLDTAGYGDIYLAFLDQLRESNFEEGMLNVGDHMEFMLFRSQGKIKVVEDLEWAGSQAIPIFLFTVKKDFKHYHLFIPRACGNIALLKVEEVIPPAVCDIRVDPNKANINDPVMVDMSGSQHAESMEAAVIGPEGNQITTKSLTPDSPKWQTSFETPGEYTLKGKAINAEGLASTDPCEAKVYINFPPVCKLWSSCLPCEDYVGRPITFDASNSYDPDGEVVKADFRITDEAGNVVDTYSDSTQPFTWEKVFDKPGIYMVTAVVTDDFGAVSEPASIELEVTQRRFHFVGEGGWQLARGSHGNYLTARLGFVYEIIPDTLDILMTGGGGLSVANSDVWKSIFQAQMLLNLHAGPAYFGGGAGFTTKVKENRNSDAELIGNVGINVIENFTLAGSVFFEVRAPIGEGRSFSDHHKLMLGFRMIF